MHTPTGAHPHSFRRPTRVWALTVTVTILTALLIGCGGGGGGGGTDESNVPGEVALQVEKSSMDSGDLTGVRVDLFDMNAGGVILKLKYPKALRYVRSSARLFKGEDEESTIDPSTEASDDDHRYLVFFLSRGSSRNGYLWLNLDLKAMAGDPDGFVEVDLDNNDPTVADSVEFSASSPRFSAQDRSDVYIDGEPLVSGTPTATPTPSS